MSFTYFIRNRYTDSNLQRKNLCNFIKMVVFGVINYKRIDIGQRVTDRDASQMAHVLA